MHKRQTMHPAIADLKRAAVRQKVTLYQIAKRSGLSHQAITYIFDGKVSPTLVTVSAIAKALGFRIGLLPLR